MKYVSRSVTFFCILTEAKISALTPRSRGFPSKTARESAVNVEWEPMTELERRLEDGVNYEHIPKQARKSRPYNKDNNGNAREDEIPAARGIFVGYYTKEEEQRLRSADPSQ